MILLQALWAKVWPYFAGAVGIIAGLIYIRQSGKAAGKQEAATEVMKRDQQAKREADAVAREVDRMDDSDLADEFDRLHDTRRR